VRSLDYVLAGVGVQVRGGSLQLQLGGLGH
jgi:hypothetical protein